MLLIANHKPQQIRELLDFFHCLLVSVARSEGGVKRGGAGTRKLFLIWSRRTNNLATIMCKSGVISLFTTI